MRSSTTNAPVCFDPISPFLASSVPYLPVVFEESEERGMYSKSYGEQKLYDLIISGRACIEAYKNQEEIEEENTINLKLSITKSNRGSLESQKDTEEKEQQNEEIKQLVGFMVKFTNVIVENSGVQFSILIYVSLDLSPRF